MDNHPLSHYLWVDTYGYPPHFEVDIFRYLPHLPNLGGYQFQGMVIPLKRQHFRFFGTKRNVFDVFTFYPPLKISPYLDFGWKSFYESHSLILKIFSTKLENVGDIFKIPLKIVKTVIRPYLAFYQIKSRFEASFGGSLFMILVIVFFKTCLKIVKSIILP